MKTRALSVLGALVLLLFGSIAGAQELMTPLYRSYLVARAIDRMSNEQASLWFTMAENTTATEPIRVQLENNVTVTFNSTTNMWLESRLKYSNKDYNYMMGFNDDHAPRGGVAQFPGADNIWTYEGYCYLLPKAYYSVSINNPTDQLLKVNIESKKKEEYGSFLYTVQISSLTSTSTAVLTSLNRDSSVPNRALADFVGTLCYKRVDKVVPFASLPYTGVLSPAEWIKRVSDIPSSFLKAGGKVNTADVTIVGLSEAQLAEPCTPTLCQGYVPPGGGGGESPPPGTGGTSAPACTQPDGTTSGNPYDCAPTDNENSCSIINLPCNLKFFFIPRENFLADQIPQLITQNFNMPTQVTDKIEMDIPLLGKPVKVGLDFSNLMMNEVFQGLIKLMCAFSCLYWLLNFFGIPNPLGGSARGNGDLNSAVKTARMKMFDAKGKK